MWLKGNQSKFHAWICNNTDPNIHNKKWCDPEWVIIVIYLLNDGLWSSQVMQRKWKWSCSVVSDSVRPQDGSPPGSPVPGILQVLHWVLTNNTATNLHGAQHVLYVSQFKKLQNRHPGRRQRLIPSGVAFTRTAGRVEARYFLQQLKKERSMLPQTPKPSLLGSDRTFRTASKRKIGKPFPFLS